MIQATPQIIRTLVESLNIYGRSRLIIIILHKQLKLHIIKISRLINSIDNAIKFRYFCFCFWRGSMKSLPQSAYCQPTFVLIAFLFKWSF